MTHRVISTTQVEIREQARVSAAQILEGILNGWEPDHLIEKIGQDNVDAVATEIHKIAARLGK